MANMDADVLQGSTLVGVDVSASTNALANGHSPTLNTADDAHPVNSGSYLTVDCEDQNNDQNITQNNDDAVVDDNLGQGNSYLSIDADITPTRDSGNDGDIDSETSVGSVSLKVHEFLDHIEQSSSMIGKRINNSPRSDISKSNNKAFGDDTKPFNSGDNTRKVTAEPKLPTYDIVCKRSEGELSAVFFKRGNDPISARFHALDKKRFCVLSPTDMKICYYTTRERTRLKGQIDLKDLTDVRQAESQISIITMKRIWKLRALELKHANEWFSLLKELVDRKLPRYCNDDGDERQITDDLLSDDDDDDDDDDDIYDTHNFTPKKKRDDLAECCINDDVAGVRRWLAAGVNVNDKLTTHGDNTPLTIATRACHVGVVECLLRANADVNIQAPSGETPSYTAAQEGFIEGLQLLLQIGADATITDEEGTTPLWIACQNNRIEIVASLLNHGISAESVDEEGVSALNIAAKKGNTEIVKQLIAAEADVNSVDDSGATPLIVACREGHLETVKTLVLANAIVDIQGKCGDALLEAKFRNHVDIVVLLQSPDSKLPTV